MDDQYKGELYMNRLIALTVVLLMITPTLFYVFDLKPISVIEDVEAVELSLIHI